MKGITTGGQQKPVAVASRTLLTAGFSIVNSRRQPGHIEIHCDRVDLFGVTVRYLLAICESENPPASDISNIEREARRLSRTLVIVCRSQGSTWISWQTFLDSLGGAVPTWRAIGAAYGEVVRKSSKNIVPPGTKGEAWQIFEDAVADGFEFVLGSRVNRLGGKSRGKRVSDMITQSPDGRVLVLDAKASRSAFNVNWPALRPLVEYTKAQVVRQRGHFEVGGAILVARAYKQSEIKLNALANDFLSDARTPLTYLRAEDLIFMVNAFSNEPTLRSSVDWGKLLCRGSLLTKGLIERELEATRLQVYPRGRPLKG